MTQTTDSTPEVIRILAALDAQTLTSTGAASGHAIREQLLNEGMDKRILVTTLSKLVAHGVLERVRITEASGLFYTAYRRCSPL